MSVKPLCIVGVAGAILLFWSAWSWDGANVLGASPQGAAGRNADNPFAEPTFKKAAAADPADPFGDVAPASKGEKKAAAPAVVKKAAAKKAAAVPGELARKAKPAPTGRAYRAAAEARIQKALDSLTELEFVDTPLSDVVLYLQDFHKINIAFDHKTLDKAGIRTDKQVTRTLKGVTLQSALRLILRELGMTYVIGDEVLLLTTVEEGEERLITKSYEVGDLVVVRDENNRLWADYRTLIDVVTPAIAPTSWEEVGGPASIHGATFGNAKLLVVSQTAEVHEKVARLLEDLMGEVRKAPGDGQPPLRTRSSDPHGARGGLKHGHAGDRQ